MQRSYFNVVRRRFSDLVKIEAFAHLWAAGAVVNGVRLPALEKLLGAAERQWPQLACLQGSGAHGDLVLEDIVLVPSVLGDKIKLVDPNPQNVSGLIDMAKLLMSARLKYEVIYAGQYECEWNIENEVLAVAFTLSTSNAWSCLDDLAEHLSQRAPWLPIWQSPMSVRSEMLEVQACLNMLALPNFHYIHHGERDRALMFAVVGMSRLRQLVF